MDNTINSLRKTNHRAWERLRHLVRQRDKYLCQGCKGKGLICLGQEVDHIIPLHKGGTDAMDNLQTLCRECHAEKTQMENRGQVVEYGEDGMPKGSDHWWTGEGR